MNLSLKNIVSKVPFKLKNILENHLINYPAPASLYYAFGFGSLLGLLLVIQVFTGVLLAMHYVPHIEEAFSSVERIMREIPSGWFLRYLHANGSSFLFILLYLHIARGIYFVSFRKPKQWVWCSGVILFILMAGIAFLGYTLPLGQMSFWGSTVITNLITALPVLGQKLVIWIWGGFAISQSTLNRFFSLHYILSIIALGLSLTHLILLHMVGSTTPVVNETELDNLKFSPAFITKDALTFLFFLLFYLIIVIYKPNIFGHPDNYIRADALVTPAHIVPEWYFLPFYAMLKAFPSKGAGALAMITSMLILITAPWLDSLLTFGGLTIDPRYRPFFKIIFIFFIIDMFMLGWLGSLAVSDINQIWMQICTFFYFIFWIIFIPLFNYLESHISRILWVKKGRELRRMKRKVPGVWTKIKVPTNLSVKANPLNFSLQLYTNTFTIRDKFIRITNENDRIDFEFNEVLKDRKFSSKIPLITNTRVFDNEFSQVPLYLENTENKFIQKKYIKLYKFWSDL